ncbi:MAG: Rab family GTPase [Candidatus Hodarchaeota archaeon]
MMEQNVILGVLYSQFDQKIGPSPVIWIPKNLPGKVMESISDKSVNLMEAKPSSPLEPLAIIPFPVLNLKGIVKGMLIKDPSRRGGYVDSAITLIFNEQNDILFHRHISLFKDVFDEVTGKVIKLEEDFKNKDEIELELEIFYNKVKKMLIDLKERDGSFKEGEEFPKDKKVSQSFDSENNYKIIVCGEKIVGKTALVHRFIDELFRSTYIPTEGVKVSEKQVKIEKDNVNLVIWDISGDAKYEEMRTHFYEGCDGVVLVFDLTAPESFKAIQDWDQDIKSTLKKDPCGVIVGNKSDLFENRKITQDEITKLCKKCNYEYIEISTKTGEHVSDIFSELGKNLVSKDKISSKWEKLSKF